MVVRLALSAQVRNTEHKKYGIRQWPSSKMDYLQHLDLGADIKNPVSVAENHGDLIGALDCLGSRWRRFLRAQLGRGSARTAGHVASRFSQIGAAARTQGPPDERRAGVERQGTGDGDDTGRGRATGDGDETGRGRETGDRRRRRRRDGSRDREQETERRRVGDEGHGQRI